jgi:rubredoxin
MTEEDRPSSPADLAPTTGKKSTAADDDRFECRACGHIYNPSKGDSTTKVIAGTPFSVLPETWKCPVCTAKKSAFTNIGTVTSEVSGFKENQGYGFGVNNMTQSQKSLLIYGGLGLGILLFLSLYTLS